MIEICNITQDFYFLFFAYSVFGTEKKIKVLNVT